MVLYQDALSLCDRFFHGVELLGDVDAGTTGFDHPDDTVQMTVGAFKALDDIRMGCMLYRFDHINHISSPGGYNKRWTVAPKYRTRMDEMARRTKRLIHLALMVSLTLAFALSSNVPSVSHGALALAITAAQHEAETLGHGHSHEETGSLVHAFDDHTHDVADHNHNVAFLHPREALNHPIRENARWLMAVTRSWPGPAFNLDRPPRG